MIRIFFAILLVLSWCTILEAQDEINYRPKLLDKSLLRENASGLPGLTELVIPEAYEGHLYQGKFFETKDNNTTNTIRYIYTGRVNSCRTGGCSVDMKKKADHDGEYFDYFMLFDAGCKILQVRVFNYQATHGQEITAMGWLNQYVGYYGEGELKTGKNIDGISGATISVEAISRDIQEKTRLLREIVQSE
jgi:Na+-translocating ferredoxin:NAD+ oxidoreductase RnfG subunit